MLAEVDSLFVTANSIEAALWSVIGVGFLVHVIVKRGGRTAIAASIAFLLFGLSDVVETRTGAWWRPWWLLALKGSCLAAFLVLLVRYVMAPRLPATPDTARPRTSTPAPP